MISLSGVWKQLTARQQRVLLLLAANKKEMSLARIVRELYISERTLKSDLAAIEAVMTQTSAKIEKGSGGGVRLALSGSADLEFLCKRAAGIRAERLDGRKLHIAQQLLLPTSAGLTELDLEKQLYVSRSSIRNELEILSGWLSEFDLTLIKRKNCGIYIEGSELGRRKALLSLFQNLCAVAGDGASVCERSTQVGAVQRKVMQELYPGFDSGPVEDMIAALGKTGRTVLQESAFVPLWFSLCTGIYRMRTGNVVKIDVDKYPELYSRDRMLLMNYPVSMLQERYQLVFPPAELAYLSMHIESSGIRHGNDDAMKDFHLQVGDFDSFLTEVVHTIETILDVEFSQDKELLRNFSYHLSCSVLRLRYGIHITNPLLPEIRENYSSVLGATWACSVLFEKYYNVQVTEDEIGFLSLYVGISVERIRKVLRACIVCDYGIGVSGLMSESLQNAVPGLLVIDVLSTAQYRQMRSLGLGNWQIVITTADLQEEVPTIRVPSVLSKEDLNQIKYRVKQLTTGVAPVRSQMDVWETTLFRPELVFIGIGPKGKRELLEFACEELQEQGCVTGDFLSSVLDRERAVSTEVGGGIAIPHGNPAYVLRPAIVVIRLADTIPWSNHHQVDLVFVLALKMERGSREAVQAKQFYKTLARILDDERLQEGLRKAKSGEDLVRQLQ